MTTEDTTFILHHTGQIEAIPTDQPALWFVATNKEGTSIALYIQRDQEGNVLVKDSDGHTLATHTVAIRAQDSLPCDSNHPFRIKRLWPHGSPQCNPGPACDGCTPVPMIFFTAYSCMHEFCCVSPIDAFTNAIPQ